MSPPEWERPETKPGGQVGWRDPAMALEEPEPAKIAWSRLSWPYTNAAETFTAPPEGTLPTVDLDIPDTFEPSAHYDPDAAMRALVLLGKKGGERWPDLVDAVHLAQAGLYDEVGPIFRAAYTEVRRIRKKGSAAEREALDALGITEKTWTLAASRATTTTSPSACPAASLPRSTRRRGRSSPCPSLMHESLAALSALGHGPVSSLVDHASGIHLQPRRAEPYGSHRSDAVHQGTGAKVSALLDEPLFPTDALQPEHQPDTGVLPATP